MVETEILIVRHGETEWNRVLRYQGHKDIELNEKGREQSQKIAKRLADKDIDVFYSSDLKRASETAEIITDIHHNPVNKLKDLREMDFGDWEGLNYDNIKSEHPEKFKKWINDPTSVRPPGGELLVEFQNRIVNTFQKIINDHYGERILAVTHGGVVRIWLAHLLQMPLAIYWRLEVHNTSLSIVKIYEDEPVISLFNSTSHLN